MAFVAGLCDHRGCGGRAQDCRLTLAYHLITLLCISHTIDGSTMFLDFQNQEGNKPLFFIDYKTLIFS